MEQAPQPESYKNRVIKIEDDLADTAFEDWAAAGTAEMEEFLAKHAEFFKFLETQDPQSQTQGSPES